MRLNVNIEGHHEQRLKSIVEEYGISQAEFVRKMISKVYYLSDDIKWVKQEMEKIQSDERYEESIALLEQYARLQGRLRQLEELEKFIMM